MWRVWLTGDGCDWLMNQFDGEEEARKYLVFIKSLKPWATGWCDQSDDEIGFWQIRQNDQYGSLLIRQWWQVDKNDSKIREEAETAARETGGTLTWSLAPFGPWGPRPPVT